MTKIRRILGLDKTLSHASAFNEKPAWQAKKLSFAEVSDKIPNGSNISIGSTCATAHATLAAIVNDKSLVDINILQFIVGGDLPHLEEHPNRFRTTTNFAFDKSLHTISQGISDYVPVSAASVKRLFDERLIPVDIAIIKVTPPNKKGMCSLGMGVDFTRESIAAAKIVIAEVSQYMPWTSGDSLIHTNDIHWWIEHNVGLLSAEELFPNLNKNALGDEVLAKIAENVVNEIPDGATLKFDLNVAVNQIVPFLKDKKDLGLHTDLLTDELLELIKLGVINNTNKNIQRGKTVVSHASGGQELLHYINENNKIEFHSLYDINRIDKIAQQNNLVAIIGGLKIDLSGQVAVDSVGSRFYTGIGSSDVSIRGAAYSQGGKPIVMLPSTSVAGNSNILFALPKGTGVTITRQDVHYVITEYGTAFLFGKSIRQRCLALIDIAHPDCRKHLLEQAKDSFYIHKEQTGNSYISGYPKILECIHHTKKDKAVFVRPIKAIDEDRLRDFFHKLSDQNVYMRYFSHIRSLSQKVLKQYSDIDYAKDMALIVLYPSKSTQQEIIGIGQWFIDAHDNVPEVAFQIRDDWQKQGLGHFIFMKLVDVANSYEISTLKADVLADNDGMNSIFENSGVAYTRKVEVGVYSYVFDLRVKR